MASVGPEILSGGSVNYNLDTAFMHFTEQEKNLLYNDIDNVPEYITNNHDSFISWLKNNKEKIKKTITKLTNGKIISCDDFSKLLINLYMLNYHGIEDQNKIEAIIKKSLDFHDADEEQIDVDLIVNDNLKILRESPVENYDFFDELIKKMKEDSPNFSPEEIKNLNKIFNYFRKIAKQKNIKLKDKIIKEFLEEISNYFVKPAIRQAFEQGKLNEMIFEEVYVMTSLISVIGVFNVKDSQLKFIYETEPEELWFEKYIKLTSENPEEIQKLLNDKSSKEKFLKKMYKYKKAKQNIKSFADEHKEKIEIVPSPPDVEIPHNKENLPDSETLENSSDDGISGSLVGDSNEGSDDGKTLENLS
ncbi:MAG: hypothetical protein LBJ09_00940, partial [Clostridiales bacterium]|nr:hypothetical protein [Clostridiales bacterium]